VSWFRSKGSEGDEPKPDPQAARAHLRRVRARRSEVDALVDALMLERKLNNFTANVVVTFRGGRQ
jgi:hypothetical protein